MKNIPIYFLSIISAWAMSMMLSAATYSQSASIAGNVIDEEGNPVSYASILIKESKQGTMTDPQGAFQLKNLAPGTYSLQISCVGYAQQSLEVALTENREAAVSIQLKVLTGELGEVIVTATRTARSIEDIPMPVDVISAERIENIGSFRLNEVLQEQTGLQIVSDHGTGLQMQGLSSDYILVLIDGEPVIGRTAGTLDLTRLTVNNIDRIEIIRGPSSSLYGSEAMAGVINLITKNNRPGFTSQLRTRYRSYNTWDLGTNVGYRNASLSASLFLNRLSTDGYDLTPGSVTYTAPPFTAYTVNPKISYRFSDKLKVSINGRWYTESQSNTTDITEGEEVVRLEEEGFRDDWNLMPTIEYHFNNHHKLLLKNYTTGYRTETDITYQQDGFVYDYSYFDQIFNRTEAQYDWYINDHHITTIGAGHTVETVKATRYDDVNAFRANYAFVQHQWMPDARFNVVVGGRLDTHSEYASRFSPKIAAGYTVNKWLKIQASVGGGYKAPDFRQLLLSFTNPTAGYSVFGASVAAEKMAELQAQGQLQAIYIDPDSIGLISAESSWAYNAGFTFTPHEKLRLRLNLFRNEIADLIDSAPIALKTNGQQVFSYFNYAEVITQGTETQLDYELLSNLTFSLGYQYLDTRDVEAWERIKEGNMYKRDPSTNRTVRLTTADYGGLINRSRHSGNAKLFYENEKHAFNIALRSIYRGRWGFGDMNGNGVVDDEREYANDYLLLHLAVNKELFEWLTLEAGINNLLGQTHDYESSLAGRCWYGGINLHFDKIKTE